MLITSVSFYVVMHLDIYEPVLFRFCVIVGTAELYIFILFLLTLASIQGHRVVRK